MNELRMYVEHLFQGKVLTAENIELKEEIYGNLVARYEDYLAQGLSEAEALTRTKASVPSIDDVLSGDAALDDAGEAEAAPTTVIPAAEPTVQMAKPAAPAAGTPVPPTPASGTSAGAPTVSPKTRPKWPMVLGIVAVALIALFGLFEFVIDPWLDHQEEMTEIQAEQEWREQQNQSKPSTSTTAGNDGDTSSNQGSSTTTGNQGANATGGSQQGMPHFDDPEDQREWEATTALDSEITGSSIDTLKKYSGDSTTKVQLFENLPLGSYVERTGTEQSGDSFDVRYGNVNEDIDGDAIDRAIVYDAVAALCVYSDLNTVNVTVHEQYDSEYDVDIFAFERATLEQLLSDASGGSVTQLNSSLYESGDQWNAVRDLVMRESVYDRATDWAERS